jgi:hypothetical protein
MTIYDALEALAAMVVAAKNTINANVHLIASGVLVSDAAEVNTSLSDPYRWLKIGDRDVVEDGLTICFIPIQDPPGMRMTGGRVDRNLYGQIAAYVQGGSGSRPMKDPLKREQAKRGVVEEFRKLFNGIPDRTLDCGAAGLVYNSYLGAARYGTLMKNGVEVNLVAIDWTGTISVDETTTG